MHQIITETNRTGAAMDDFTVVRLMAAMAAFMAADSEAEAAAEIDRDLQRAA
jgi:hypothetical protein